MANRYWVGGTAAWDATAGTKWALTSGAAGGEAVPTAADDVFFDGASGAVTCTITGARVAKSITCTGFTGTLAGASAPALTISGSLTLNAGMTLTYAGTTTFDATGTITSAGKTLGSVTVNGSGITVTLADALNVGTSSGRTLTLTQGTFSAVSYNVTAYRFASTGSSTRTLNMGSGLWTIAGVDAANSVWEPASTGLTLNKDTADILLSNTSTSARAFVTAGFTYNKLTIGGATGTSTLVISGSGTFSELASTKTVAHTISFGGNPTFGAWSVTGTAGNVVTVNSTTGINPRTLTKSGGGYLTGIDYLNVRNIIGSPTDTWYIGANSVINTTPVNVIRELFTTQRASNAVIVLTSTVSANWTVPDDWNSASNTIHLIGGGGAGGVSAVSGNNRAGGGGGGGGGYTRLTNQILTAGASIAYQAGARGENDGLPGSTTSWNSGAATAGGGGGGQATTTPTSTGGTAGVGSTYNGGAGGAGSTSTLAGTGNGGGGGGGAGGPNGTGGGGGNGFASTTTASIAGGGGGGNGGGTNGGNATSATGGTGGNNSLGTGGGACIVAGVFGGGGGGTVSAACAGGNGIEIFGVGSGGGAGGCDDSVSSLNNIGGAYGGGGAGGGVSTAGGTVSGRPGSQGAIIITYVPSPPAPPASAAQNFVRLRSFTTRWRI